ncbi:MAG: D-alanyl-D-alanine carboxypeptidase [Thermotogae bacterium]|nr:D-alanyl-D-alanine carboxypeptidase [Thermotogota bacterium]
MKKLIIFLTVILITALSFSAPIKLEKSGSDNTSVFKTISGNTSDKTDENNGPEKIINSVNCFTGIVVRDLETENIIYEYNKDKMFIPASLNKLLVTYAALKQFGASKTFETKIYFDNIPQPLYNGNIYIKGFGDPYLSKDEYENFIKSVMKKYNIEEISGNIYFDYSYYSNNNIFGKGWMWDDSQPQIEALDLYSDSPEVFRTKTYSAARDINEFITVDTISSMNIRFRGEIYYAKVPEDIKYTETHYSAKLSEILKKMLKVSDNYIAEMLYRDIGAETGEYYTQKQAERIITEITDKSGINGFIIKDGAGLSMYNLISPENINRLILELNKIVYLRSYLATPSEESTIKERFDYPVWAKTGSLNNSSGIAGILYTKKGTQLVFTVMENNYSVGYYDIKEYENKIIDYFYNNY